MNMLCIDGGGIRGVFAIAILNEIENEYGCPISELFDVIAGTSTGSVIAASITLNKNMNELLESYKTYGEKIFIRQARVGLFKSVYSDRFLRLFFNRPLENELLPMLVNLSLFQRLI